MQPKPVFKSEVARSSRKGFIGAALYVIVWVVATPLMIVVCIIGGVIHLIDPRQAERDEARGRPHN